MESCVEWTIVCAYKNKQPASLLQTSTLKKHHLAFHRATHVEATDRQDGRHRTRSSRHVREKRAGKTQRYIGKNLDKASARWGKKGKIGQLVYNKKDSCYSFLTHSPDKAA
ncbi:hypothetical protein [Alloprevotella tannerae]|uniref:hypothetical protein n=1 Tax=Alloprevotella tannerae TaxID=76122 RepID=UPI0028ED4335|nr:hypothetical protein [Alloprevotella tannerae]